MLLLAASTTVEKLKALPPEVWLKAGGVLLGFIAAVIALRKLAKINSLFLLIGGATALAVVSLSMIYYRTEPKWLTPVVDIVAPFFPSQDAYGMKQAK